MHTASRLTFALLAASALTNISPASAQSVGVVVMRKPIDLIASRREPAVEAPGAQWRTGDWTWSSAEYCTDSAPQRRTVECVRDGAVVADGQCVTDERPEDSRTQPRTGGCYFIWKAGPWSAPLPACGETTQSRTMTCVRSDGSPADEEQCQTRKGETVQPSVDFSTCGYDWSIGPWSEWSSACSSSATRSRDVVCQRADGSSSDNAKCEGATPDSVESATIFSGCGYHWDTSPWKNIATPTTCGTNDETRIVRCVSDSGTGAEDAQCGTERPETSRSVNVVSGCSYAWDLGEWSDVTPSCGMSERTRTAVCRRSDGEVSDPKECGPSAPTVKTEMDYRACTFDWSIGEWSPWSSTCDAAATRERTVECIRSDGETDSDGRCTGGIPVSKETGAVYSGCGYSWSAGAWQMPSGCGAVEKTRTVQCLRSNGTVADPSFCDSAGRPITQESGEDYRACSYQYHAGEWGSWSSTCSNNAKRTRDVSCVRGDGGTVAAGNCSDLSKPGDTEYSAVYSGCNYQWVSRGWTAPPLSCGEVTISEIFACKRSNDDIVDDAQCPGPKPSNTKKVGEYSQCDYAWGTGEWSAWNSTCSSKAKRTRTVDCYRSTGEAASSDEFCAGAKPESEETGQIYSGCSYEWEAGEWTSLPYCGAIQQTREVHCKRSDDQYVNSSYCADAGEAPAAQRDGSNYDACTYAWKVGEWSDYDSSCSTTATRTRSVQCERSDLEIVANGLCSGVAPTSSEQTGIYTSCQYKWTAYPWESSYACSEADVQTRRVECTRADDISSTVPDSYCSAAGTRPVSSQTVANKTECSYALVNGSFESELYGWNFTNPVSVSTTIGHTGTNSIKMDKDGQLRQYVQTVSGKKYTLSYWAYTKKGLYMNSYGAQGKVIENRVLTNTAYQWVQFTGTFTGTGGVVQIGFYHYAPSGGTSWLDDVTVTSN